MDIPTQLFQDYCYYREHTDNIKLLKKTKPYLKSLKSTVDRLKLFDYMNNWCMSRNIPVRQWLYTLFVARYWKVSPKLEIGHLCSEKHIPKFYKVQNYEFFDKYTHSTFSKRSFDSNVELVSSVEQRKRDLLLKGGGQLCIAHMKDETFGFHPKSIICNHCDSRFVCYDELIKLVGQSVIDLRTASND